VVRGGALTSDWRCEVQVDVEVVPWQSGVQWSLAPARDVSFNLNAQLNPRVRPTHLISCHLWGTGSDSDTDSVSESDSEPRSHGRELMPRLGNLRGGSSSKAAMSKSSASIYSKLISSRAKIF